MRRRLRRAKRRAAAGLKRIPSSLDSEAEVKRTGTAVVGVGATGEVGVGCLESRRVVAAAGGGVVAMIGKRGI